MKNVSLYPIAIAMIALLSGCSPKEGAAPAESAAPTAISSPVGTGQPIGSLKVGGRAICAVCAVKEGTKEPEEIKAVIDYKGKSYGFCDEAEKAEFISNPARYAQPL